MLAPTAYFFTTQSRLLVNLEKKPFGNGNIVGKGEHFEYQHFLLFMQCFHAIPEGIPVFNLPKQQIFVSFKLKEFADDNFQFGKSRRKFFKEVENFVGKGEIARCNFSFSHGVFKRLVLQTRENQGCLGKG